MLEPRYSIAIRMLIFVLIIIFQNTGRVYSQRFQKKNEFTFNTFPYNPAATGSEGYTIISTSARRQWLSIKGAPQIYTFNVQSHVNKPRHFLSSFSARRRYGSSNQNKGFGIGGQIYCYRAGIFNRTSFQTSYAYHKKISRSQLSFGVSLSLLQFKLDLNKAIFEEEDMMVLQLPRVFYIPDIGAGIYYKDQNAYAGISIENITKMSNRIYVPYALDYESRILNIHGGNRFRTSDDLIIDASLYFKAIDFKFAQAELNVKALFRNTVWAACSYRTTKVLSFQAGMKTGILYWAYVFDYNMIDIQRYSLGSHEIMLAVKLADHSKSYQWLNRY